MAVAITSRLSWPAQRAVNDPKAGSVTCLATTLAVGASTTCTADNPYVITAADVTAGHVANTAVATGKDPDGGDVTSPPDSTDTPVDVAHPSLLLDKQAGTPTDVNHDGLVDAGDTIQFTFVLTNNGDVPLNEPHYAVCGLVGSSGSTRPTSDQRNGLRDAIEYCRRQGPACQEIKGHRDGYATDCPGPVLYAWVRAGAPRPSERKPAPAV